MYWETSPKRVTKNMCRTIGCNILKLLLGIASLVSDLLWQANYTEMHLPIVIDPTLNWTTAGCLLGCVLELYKVTARPNKPAQCTFKHLMRSHSCSLSHTHTFLSKLAAVEKICWMMNIQKQLIMSQTTQDIKPTIRADRLAFNRVASRRGSGSLANQKLG